jgi:hypothetical protein
VNMAKGVEADCQIGDEEEGRECEYREDGREQLRRR